jgi:hypothetical protein
VSSGDEPKGYGYGMSRRHVESDVRAVAQREDVAQAPRGWRWLEELRLRFELTIELVGVDLAYLLDPIPGAPAAGSLRAALDGLGQTALRAHVASLIRSGKPRSLTVGALRIRLFPLFMRSSESPMPAGVLVIADRVLVRPHEQADESFEATDRRLDGVGQWLAAAIEASLGTTLRQAKEARGAELITGSFDIIDALTQLETDREIVALLMDALALWYDADVYVYRQDLSGAFVLHACLPGVDPSRVPAQLPGHQIWGRGELFTPETPREIDELGWPPSMGRTLFEPLVVDQSTEWLLAIAGTDGEPVIQDALSVLGRIVGTLLTDLQRQSVERLTRKLTSILLFGGAPFHETARMALEAVAIETGASSVQFATYAEQPGEPLLSLQWGGATATAAPFVDAGTTSLAPQAIGVGVGTGSGTTAVLSLKRDGGTFGPGAQRLARSAASTIGIWLSGSMIASLDLRVPGKADYGSDLAQRMKGQVDQFGHVKVGGAVAVVLPQRQAPTGSGIDDAVDLIEDHVRPSDVVGVVGMAGAGVLLADATRDVASAVVGRLLRAAREKGLDAVRVGVAMFTASSESPEAVLERALMNARRGSVR